ncbi:TetR family transcriptional regulator [Gordonia iterans]|uniref:TetR family transcriptional regulator n=1 Tax=Gordonia iterans TaxID=1004901 RepID=A0A2S0KI26_9ACTN|nr:TetR/AcrR family transcriptional regulator [Gordonia iterans]AVM01291.1 TetR family transcriptional regulator [Gordonia iterans]
MSSESGRGPALQLLPETGAGGERADAARNRQLLLAAAKQLIDDHGAAAVTMDAVARAAGVGKGTVFRRFGNRTGLMMALLDHSERALQQQILTGPPPLGPGLVSAPTPGAPGASPLDRLIAYGRARLKMTVDHLDILLEAGADDPDRLSHPVWAMSTSHVQYLLGELGYPGRLATVAVAIQSPLEAIAVRHQLEVVGLEPAEIADDWERMVRALAAGLS